MIRCEVNIEGNDCKIYSDNVLMYNWSYSQYKETLKAMNNPTLIETKFV